MKYRVIGIVTILLITLLFCACAAEAPQQTLPATEPTEALPHTQTETLHGTARQVLEQTFDDSGFLTEDRVFGYGPDGNLTESAVTVYDAEGAARSYHRKTYSGSRTASSLTKEYRSGSLIRQVEVLYHPDGSPRSVGKWEFSESGTLLSRSSRVYGASGSLIAEETEQLDEQSGFRIIRGESCHENGSPALRRSGIYHGQSLRLLNGKSESFDENGTLRRLEEALWDGEQRMGRSECYEYSAKGAVISSLQAVYYYDSLGREIACEVTTREGDSGFAGHFTENRSFDSDGRMTGNVIRHYKEDGTPAEQYTCSYRYDSAGNLIFEQKLHELTPGVRQNLAVTEFTYDAEGTLIRQVQTGFDKDDTQKFQTAKDFDSYGRVSTFLTVSNLGNRYTYTYTYDERGLPALELLTTEYRSGSRTDYQETAYEYHENGNYKRISVHKWTSHDEAQFPDAPTGDLGQTTVTEYDEDGNKQ